MDVVSLCPLHTASLVWQPRRGTFALTVVCKATYALVPGEAPLAHEQEYPNEDDNHWNDDEERSLYSPSDLVPYKPRADVMLVGHAFAPRKEAVRSLIVRLMVGEVDKSIEVFGERWFGPDGTVRDGAGFTRMPLRYERAAGGPETSNPVGVRLAGRPDVNGNIPLPNLQPTGVLVSELTDALDPIGFGPIAPTWPMRRDRLGRHGARFGDRGRAFDQPIPEDLDPGYFMAAPRDQQVETIRPNERIVLENLHPEHPRLATMLPGLLPQAFVEKRGSPPHELSFTCDTLWIDTDRRICTATWRGHTAIEHPKQEGRVLIGIADPGQRLTWADIERLSARIEAEAKKPPLSVPPRRSEPPRSAGMVLGRNATLPFARGSVDADGPPTALRSSDENLDKRVVRAGTLPFTTTQVGLEGEEGIVNEQTQHSALPFKPVTSVVVPLNDEKPPPSSSKEVDASTTLADASPPWLAPAARPSPSASISSPPTATPGSETPWLLSSRSGGLMLTSKPPSAPPPSLTPNSLTVLGGPPANGGDGAPKALHAGLRLAKRRDVVEILWFERTVLRRVHADPRWRETLAGSVAKSRAVDDEFEPIDEAHARRDLARLFTRNDPAELEALEEAMNGAVTEDGLYVPPLVHVAGELRPSLEVSGAETGEAAERALVARRGYQTRTLLGETWIRSGLSLGRERLEIPAYLPEGLWKLLPLSRRFVVHALAEAVVRQDESETHPVALRVVALARVVVLPEPRRSDPHDPPVSA